MGKTGNNRGRDTKTGRFQPGNTASIKHGCWSLTSRGKIPSIRGMRSLKQDLEAIRTELVEITPRMTPGKRLLIGQIIRSEAQIRLIELFFRKAGIMRPDKWRRGILESHPVLQDYRSFLHTQRSAVQALGIEPTQMEEVLSPFQIIEKEENKGASS